jgi:hypothetical protein
LKLEYRVPQISFFWTWELLAKLSSGFGLCQGTTSVVPQMAHSDFSALATAELQTTENN